MENRIYFKKFVSQNDFLDFFKLVTNEELMVMNYGRVFSKEEAEKFYSKILEQNKIHKDFGYFKVLTKDNSKFIGLAALSINKELTETEIEYLLFPDCWRQKYGSEISQNLLEMVKEVKSIKSVIAMIDPNNVASRKILLNNKFVSCEVFKINDGSLSEKLIKKVNC